MRLSHIILAALFAVSASLSAAPSQAPKVQPATAEAEATARVTALSGKVEWSNDGKAWSKVKIGQGLIAGARLRSKQGNLTLLLTDGSTVKMTPNTEMAIKAHNPKDEKGGTLLRLSKGFIRFLVAKVRPGHYFKVETPNAVAAVKGTFAGTGYEGDENGNGKTDVDVYEHDGKGKMEVEDPDTGKKEDVGEGESLEFDGEEFKEEKLDDQDKEDAKNDMQDLNQGQGEQGNNEQGEQGQGKQGQGEQGQGEQGQGEQGQQDQGEQGSGDGTDGQGDEADEFAADLGGDMIDELNQDAEQDGNNLKNDIENSRLVYDRKGFPAYVTNKVNRPAADTLVKVIEVNRDFGPDAGITQAQETVSYNQALPYLWMDVVSKPVTDSSNLNQDGYPIYWRTYSDFWASNPGGETFWAITYWDSPYFTNSGTPDTGTIAQGFEQSFYINYSLIGAVGQHVDPYWETLGGNYPTNQYGLYNCYSCGYDWSVNTSVVNNSAVYKHVDNYNSTTYFTIGMTLLNDDGVSYDPLAYIHDDLGNPLGSPSAPHPNFNQLGYTGLNLEMSITASGMSNEISLILLPGMFDLLDAILVPAGYSVCNIC